MSEATKPLHNRLALVFDFDETLAEDSFDALLRTLGFDPESFREERIDPLLERGWEKILARSYRLVELRERDGVPISTETFAEVGRNIRLFEGVEEMFGRVRACAKEIVPDIEVEFYLLSSGIEEIVRASAVAHEFKTIWGCEFHADDAGHLKFLKKIITHPEKTRYLLQLSQGLSEDGGDPADVYGDVDTSKLYVPLSQVIYVGDGASDMPAFELMHNQGGIAFGIFKGQASDWRGRAHMRSGRRVQNLAPANFREDAELMRSLLLATELIGKQVALRKLSEGE